MNTLEQYEDFMKTSKFYPQDKLPITYPVLGLNGEDGLNVSMKKVKERQETNTIHGNGDNREKINSYPQRYMRDNWYDD